MDQQFTPEHWTAAYAAAIETISEASGSARIVTEMLRIWAKTAGLDLTEL